MKYIFLSFIYSINISLKIMFWQIRNNNSTISKQKFIYIIKTIILNNKNFMIFFFKLKNINYLIKYYIYNYKIIFSKNN